jgi:hypothetical protein
LLLVFPPESVIHAKVAVQIFACGGLLCGRIVRLQHPRDQAGQLVRDLENPESSIAAASAVRPNYSLGATARGI